MPQRPPPQLVALLEQLGAATPGEVRGVHGRVRRLARGLPSFDSVWIDALSQARILTPFQAAEVGAGRGLSLRVGPFLLCEPSGGCNFLPCYRARRVDTQQWVRLAVVAAAPSTEHTPHCYGSILDRLQALVTLSKGLTSVHLAPITEAGLDGQRSWAAAPWVQGRSAAEWMVHHGRLPGEAAMEIARQMLAGLVDLEKQGVCHGDISLASVMLVASGQVVLQQPGLRGIVRPSEGFAQADLRPDAYDAMAPERVAEGGPPTVASDIYACGCVWWHMLCGRPPLGGGDSRSRLRAAQTAAIVDVRTWAYDAPEDLVAAIRACLERDPERRPESFERLAATLGLATAPGRHALARCLGRSAGPSLAWSPWEEDASPRKRLPQMLTSAAALLILTVAIAWPLWRAGHRAPGPPRHDAAGAGQVAAGRPDAAKASVGRPRIADNQVLPAHFEKETSSDLLLPADRATGAGSLRLTAGQCIRAAAGRRATLAVPPEGLAIAVDRLRFENVDFVEEIGKQGESGDELAGRAIIRLSAAQAEFRGCTFTSAPGAWEMPAAILWTHAAQRQPAPLSLPSGRVRLRDCVFHRVAAAIDARRAGALSIEMASVLCVGWGPLVQLKHCPSPDEPVKIVLSRVTLRGSGGVLACQSDRIETPAGEIAIVATDCVFAPGPGTALLLAATAETPEPLINNVKWTGQGSLVLPETAVAAWRRPDGTQQVLDDAAIPIAGLVRSRVEFAGPADRVPAGSRPLRWQAPLESTAPPDADVDLLPPLPR